jgi:hypothetical protein
VIFAAFCENSRFSGSSGTSAQKTCFAGSGVAMPGAFCVLKPRVGRVSQCLKNLRVLRARIFISHLFESLLDHFCCSLQIGRRVFQAEKTRFKLGRREVDALAEAKMEVFSKGGQI